jgi:hypothetical protein
MEPHAKSAGRDTEWQKRGPAAKISNEELELLKFHLTNQM